mmetsp:Transcript_5465/g.11874  ORF Transcript_5465/g.11874 Transcript_5465/m.11874 type:complete len:239 (-) Transcript_5465:461-1177(-)
MQTYAVTVPAGARPGSIIQVSIGGQGVPLRVPPGAYPGSTLRVTLPSQPPDLQYTVTVPNGSSAGTTFLADVQGKQLRISVPPGLGPGSQLTIRIPSAMPPPSVSRAQPSGPAASSGTGNRGSSVARNTVGSALSRALPQAQTASSNHGNRVSTLARKSMGSISAARDNGSRSGAGAQPGRSSNPLRPEDAWKESMASASARQTMTQSQSVRQGRAQHSTPTNQTNVVSPLWWLNMGI